MEGGKEGGEWSVNLGGMARPTLIYDARESIPQRLHRIENKGITMYGLSVAVRITVSMVALRRGPRNAPVSEDTWYVSYAKQFIQSDGENLEPTSLRRGRKPSLCGGARPVGPVLNQSETAISQSARKFPRLVSALSSCRFASLARYKEAFQWGSFQNRFSMSIECIRNAW